VFRCFVGAIILRMRMVSVCVELVPYTVIVYSLLFCFSKCKNW
jgi:hypothetical protein